MREGGLKFFLLAVCMSFVGLILTMGVIFLSSPYEGGGSLVDGVYERNIYSIIMFYVSLFVFITGFFAAVFFWIRNKFTVHKELYLYAMTSFRQGLLMGLLICSLLFLQSLQWFIWWDVLLVLGVVILMEMYLAVK